MLNPFPVQFLAPLAYFFLRVVLGALCLQIGIRMLRKGHSCAKRRALGTIFLGAGTLLVVGLHTQFAALIVLFFSGLGIVRSGMVRVLSRTSLALMCAIAISLFITGAGLFAFDLPI